MRPPTLSDVAQQAGVSYATADRVVNARGRVSEKTMRKVQKAVQDLGYIRNVSAANLSQGRRYRFVFLLPTGPNAFFRRMQDILKDRQHRLGPDHVDIELQEVPAFEQHALSTHLAGLAAENLDGLAVVGLESAEIATRVARLREKGLPVVSLVSDLPSEARTDYIGIDNLAAGRTAARMVGLAHSGNPGQVLVCLGSLQARDHRDRLTGFKDVLGEDFPNIEILPEIEGRDLSDVVEEKTRDALKVFPDITAIYNIGAGNRGLTRVIESRSPKPFCIAHELVDHTRDAMQSGVIDVIIDQCPEQEIDAALSLMRAQIDRMPTPALPALLPTIFVRDNLPPDSSQPK